VGIEYKIDAVSRTVFIRCADEIDVNQFFRTTDLLRSDPLFDPDYNAVIDFTDVTKADAPYAELRHFAKSEKGTPFSPKARRVAVAPQDFMYGVMRMYQALRNEEQFEVVRTRAEAQQLLGRDRAASAGSEG